MTNKQKNFFDMTNDQKSTKTYSDWNPGWNPKVLKTRTDSSLVQRAPGQRNVGQINSIIISRFSFSSCCHLITHCIIVFEFFINEALKQHTIRRGFLRWLTCIRSLEKQTFLFRINKNRCLGLMTKLSHQPRKCENSWQNLKSNTFCRHLSTDYYNNQ